MRVDQFDFDLPDASIALRPAHPRDAARLLVVRPGRLSPAALDDRFIRDLPELLAAGDVLVVNDTRVIPARLDGFRARGEALARIEATLHKREGGDLWRAFLRPAKKLRAGETILFSSGDAKLAARVVEKGEDGEVLLGFELSGAELDLALERVGRMPLPPYISSKRGADESDAADYQTLFADRPGAVAAPTASLHFTPALLAALVAKGVQIERVTLHVGAGTFLPVKAEDTDDHRMHAEWGEVSAETAGALNAARRAGRRVVAAGTTSLRILESAAGPDGAVAAFSGDTSIFITPGYSFKAVDLLLTNFHLPRSTLFMLVCAFSGLQTMRDAYNHAIAAGYRFYSYGDACLLYPAAPRGAA
ncbi:S-adenosylmethionine/tRNA-ribosyltransferase-isomerase [Methylocella silvestris BL2]|uniref:S-adenosylmethionine:tRNA ribosyltransferase-isomerase n=1 Tax=Methylocella silvestris (strain DSM 15510 / CIP 108128 / LMG 27833 / NCIMB 13906 / BL2) TaxID=395965 RepID=QUEA_METSB|nr:tRNA preQ1(34) S-adenosylmethionine ribosyltransferase-isomerase QueA [Methylocella silvestris]B8EIV1.1 RecName: Full=S-adenosylmethionine:tRNA ribosyltransferase-isomerase; AltName: Full=Queuosine biosynthesis protein QueA [Methylocella silvestris BL2]ACK52443.1 S-adenosylmethionine/tRNA-ribosyltransferase-isomerase [Methylocella silvestris BL2]